MNILNGSILDYFSPVKRVYNTTQDRDVVKFVEDAQAEFRAKKAYEAAEDAARREEYARKELAAAQAGRNDFAYNQWRVAEDAAVVAAAPQKAQSNILMLAAAAAAALYFWKG